VTWFKVFVYSSSGYRPSQRAREAAQKKGVTTLKICRYAAGYSLITMYHVLERIPDIDAQLKLVNS
jgi:hypothetical protein